MRGLIVSIALFLSVFGAVQSWEGYRFVSDAMRLQGKVYAVEVLRGSPKPRQKIPVHVEYELNGKVERAEISMPLLGSLAQGDSVPLWVSTTEPERALLAQPSALFAAPLTYLSVGILALVLSLLYRRRS